MQPHDESVEVSSSLTDQKASPQKLPDPVVAAEITTLTCSGCGKIGVTICAKCCKKRGVIARLHPLQERDPELYKRLDEMSRLPLQGNKQLWDEFCIEIGAGYFYEDLPTLVEILQQGKWRTGILHPRTWLRKNLARRVKRSRGHEDFGPAVDARRRPSFPKFDKRNGALVASGTQPFAEFEGSNQEGDAMLPEEVIEGGIAQKALQAAGCDDDDGFVVVPADRDSLRSLGQLSLDEKNAVESCASAVEVLKEDKSEFDEGLACVINDQRKLAAGMGLDQEDVLQL